MLRSCFAAVLLTGMSLAPGHAQAPNPSTAPAATASTEFALGKWAEMEAASHGQGNYVEQALQHYSAAMAADPHSAYIASQMADLLSRIGRSTDAITLASTTVKEHPGSVVAHQTLGRIYLRELGGERQPIAATAPAMAGAVTEYQALIRLQPNNVDPVIVLGKLLGAQGDAAAAEKQFRAALAVAPTNMDALASLVQALASQNQLPAAQAVVDGLPAQARTGPVYATLGDAFASHRQYEQAATAYRQAVAADPDEPSYQSALAKTLLDGNDFPAALAAYQRLARQTPGDGDAQLRIGQLQMRLGQYDAAATSLHNAARLLPSGNLEVAYAQALLADERGQEQDALTALRGLVARKTGPATQSIFLSQLARIEMRTGDQADAAQHLQQLETLGPVYRARAHALEIEIYSGERDYPDALAAVRAALRDEPDSQALKLTQASLLAANGQIAAAEASLPALLHSDSGDWQVFLTRGQIEQRARQWEAAAADTRHADQLATASGDHARAVAQLGDIELAQQHYALAEQQYRQALQLDPSSPAILNDLGYTLAQQNQSLDEALGYVRQAVQQDADNGAYLDSLGWVYFKMNRLPEAVQNLERAARLAAHNPAILDHLAQAYEGDGKLQQAESSWQQALSDLKAEPAPAASLRSSDIQRKLEAVRDRIAQTAHQP